MFVFDKVQWVTRNVRNGLVCVTVDRCNYLNEDKVVHEVETRDVLEVLEPRVERELTEVSLAVNDVVESAQRRARAG